MPLIPALSVRQISPTDIGIGKLSIATRSLGVLTVKVSEELFEWRVVPCPLLFRIDE